MVDFGVGFLGCIAFPTEIPLLMEDRIMGGSLVFSRGLSKDFFFSTLMK